MRSLSRLLIALALFALLFVTTLPVCASDRPEILPLDQIKPGMKGEAYTIFAGDTIEKIELEVVGIMPNLLGPGEHIILVLLKGPKVEYTGVVAGMSGSPVYIEGKLAGALSLRFGLFAKEPLAGVTPIESILRANQAAAPAATARGAAADGESTEPAGQPTYPIPPEMASRAGQSAAAGGAYLAPIETPLVFSGFHPTALQTYGSQFAAMGFVATAGGTAAAQPGDADIKPGDMVSMVLMQGDLSVQASCTVSAIIGDQVYVCGHPILGYGPVEMPMARGRVLTTLSSVMSSTKIVNAGGTIGAFGQDRLTGVVGRLGTTPRMIPVELTFASAGQQKTYRFEVVEHPKLTSLLVGMAVSSGIVSRTEYSEGVTFQVSGAIQLKDYPPVSLDNMFAPTDLPQPDGAPVALSIQGIFARIFSNAYQKPNVEKIALRVETLPERRWAVIENAWTSKSEVSPGEEISVKVLLRPYRGQPQIQEIPIQIPAQAAKGQLRVLVSDSETLNRMSRMFTTGPQARLAGLAQLVSLLNRERRNHRLYVTLLQQSPTLLLDNKELPNVPVSQIYVLDQRRATGSAVLLRESVAGEWSVPLNQVIVGQYTLTLTVK
jgi:hypothetical protein